jgi:hypothetical protein
VGFLAFAGNGAVTTHAATLVVTNANDSGPGSLRATVAAAGSGDTITFAPGVNGTPIVLQSGEINIGTSVTVTGNGPSQTIIQAGFISGRVFEIADGATVTISRVSIEKGLAFDFLGGGGILVRPTANLNLVGSLVSGNESRDLGGGIRNFGGTMTIIDSTISNNQAQDGGGIENDGTLTVTGSTLSANSAPYGGGIYERCCFSSLAIDNSTFAGNSATNTGGAIFNDPYNFVTTVTSSTFSGNSATSGGGIENYERLRITGTILANNAGGNCGFIAPTDGGANLSFPAADTCGFSIGSGDVVGGDPVLGPLQSNGGPTQTMALGVGSAAIDAGGTCPAADRGVDQRGLPRTSACDIGAFEVQSTPHTGPLRCTAAPEVTLVPDPQTAGVYDWFIHGAGGLDSPGAGSCVSDIGLPSYDALIQGSGTSIGLGICSPQQPGVSDLEIAVTLVLQRSTGGTPLVVYERFAAAVSSYPLISPIQVIDDTGTQIGAGTIATRIALKCPPRGDDDGKVDWSQTS